MGEEARGMKEKILVIDDEDVMQDILGEILSKEGYRVEIAATGEKGLELVAEKIYDLIILDVMLPGIDGIETLRRIRALRSSQMVIMISAYASVENAIEAMKEGAFDYIPKPFKNEEVLLTVRRGLEEKQLKEENLYLKKALQEKYSFKNIIGKSARMQQVFELIHQVAPSKSTVLVEGESGTGKELVAKAIHQLSPRAKFPFVTVTCSSMPVDLLESNLFGHEKGAFTGAIAAKKGLFEVADGGTVFLDEIATIGLDTQAKLLRVIQEREFMRLGSVESIRVNVRIIAATNVDLKRMVDEGRFREDLFYRINVINIRIPALRERKEDIPLLVEHFVRKYAAENEKKIAGVGEEAMDLLLGHSWPGNVRELENLIEKAVVLTRSETIPASFVADDLKGFESFPSKPVQIPPEGIPFKETISQYEKELIITTLKTVGGVQKKAARLLQLKPTTLNEMIKRHGIVVKNYQ
jgi:DNA-binding NtrC family response regulator